MKRRTFRFHKGGGYDIAFETHLIPDNPVK